MSALVGGKGVPQKQSIVLTSSMSMSDKGGGGTKSKKCAYIICEWLLMWLFGVKTVAGQYLAVQVIVHKM